MSGIDSFRVMSNLFNMTVTSVFASQRGLPVSRAIVSANAAERFSIQSISKVFLLTLAIHAIGEKLFKRVGREPSGNPFNSLVQLEREQGKPRNPFINAGALVITDMLASQYENPQEALLDFVRDLANGGREYVTASDAALLLEQ